MASPLRGGSSTVEGPDNFIVVLSVSSVVSLELFGVVLLFSASLYPTMGVCDVVVWGVRLYRLVR